VLGESDENKGDDNGYDASKPTVGVSVLHVDMRGTER